MPEVRAPSARDIILVVSVDTEEDNWYPSGHCLTVENIRELPRLEAFFRRLGVRATYFTTYRVAVDPEAADILRTIGDAGQAEIAAHLHPWNTPPMEEAPAARNSMLKNLPAELQLAKLESLTTALHASLGISPIAFRAGRYGLGPETVRALIRCGYTIDSSVTPFVSWEEMGEGPTFVGAPVQAYRLAGRGDVRLPEPDGPLLEIPVSCGYNRSPFTVWSLVHRALGARAVRPLRLRGIAARTGVIKRIMLSPETASVPDMLTLSSRLIDHGVRHLHLVWHSPSLRPGLSPFVATTADRARLYASIESYIEGLAAMASVTFATISEAAAALTAAGGASHECGFGS